ncbi:MAG: 30S ribosomal protein S6 [Deltaproteobacteria bacterium]|nr:30S ribosomal protein S6 [Deltaproteobacteria bacterium]
MKEYETLFLLQYDSTPEKVETFNTRLGEIIKNFKGQLFQTFNLGKRRLAYPVQKQDQGVYVWINYAGEGGLVAEIERILKYEDSVLKFITVKLSDEANVEERVKNPLVPVLSTYDEYDRNVA